jgi:hypothetical protein
MIVACSPASPATPPAAVSTKLCRLCCRDLPLEEFRKRYGKGENGQRKRHECRQCWNEYVRERKRRDRPKKLASFVRQSAANDVSVAKLARLATVMIRRFGGLEAFAATWIQEFDAARERLPGSMLVMHTHQAIANMMLAVASHQPAPPSFEHLSDEELHRELERLSPV